MKYKLLFVAVSTAAFFSSCKKDDDNPTPEPHEEEVITTLKLRFENLANANDTVWFQFKDPDGDGGSAPTIHDTISLDNTKDYLLTLKVLNESDTSNIEDISSEILTEADDHQFFFTGTAISSSVVSVVYGDQDGMGNPLGLSDTCRTLSTSASSVLRVTLRHEPVKTATGVSGGDITNAGGETDIEVDFQLIVN